MKKVYSVVCNRCEKSLGKTDEEPNIVVCLDCYYDKDKPIKYTKHKLSSHLFDED